MTPDLPRKVGLVEPGLVDVDQAPARLEQGQHFQRILLSKHEAALRISLDRYFAGSSIPEAELLSHNVPNSNLG